MNSWRSAAAAAALCLLTVELVSAQEDDATLLRVFLRDGTALVSYGEFARVGDRVIFSMPTASTANPPLQLANIPADRVDWERTTRYADAARAARYADTQAESDYIAINNAIAGSGSNLSYHISWLGDFLLRSYGNQQGKGWYLDLVYIGYSTAQQCG